MPNTAPRSRRCCGSSPRRRKAGPRCRTTCRGCRTGQDTIYYLAGDNVDALKTSPQLEGFRAKGIEVLLMSDPIDAFWPERLDSFEGKKLRSVTQAAEDLGKDDDAAGYLAAAGGDEEGAGGRTWPTCAPPAG